MFLPHTRLCQPQALDAESSPEKGHATCSDAHCVFWRTNALQKRPRNWCLTMCITVLHTGCAAEASRFTSAYGGAVDHWCEFTRAMRLFCLCPPHPRWYSTSCGNGCQCSLLTWLALKLMSTCTANRWTRRRLPAKHIPLFIPSSRASPHRTRKKNCACSRCRCSGRLYGQWCHGSPTGSIANGANDQPFCVHSACFSLPLSSSICLPN